MSATLEVTDLTKEVNGHDVISGVTFKLPGGKIVGLLGPVGAGKTTVLNIISGLDTEYSGEIRIDGKILEGKGKKNRNIIGYVPSEISFYPELSVIDNLEFFGGIYGLSGGKLSGSINGVMKLLQLSAKREEKAKNLSTAIKRRLNLACSILHAPQLLLLDEPVKDLDFQNSIFILDCISEIKKKNNCTILYAGTFLKKLETLLQYVLIIRGGRIIAEGNVEELVARLSGGMIYLTLESSGTEIYDRLKSIPDVLDVSCESGVFVIRSKNCQETLNDIVPAVHDMDYGISEIKVLKPGFESAYVHLTRNLDYEEKLG
ncbi:MAG: ABC transporter ATP-binding protein [Candidatus Eremiobacteraeota bacterium]|nr:ABC transporter ATP-binding protein [Candidatus Eremiobacteraeota bacterium]